jgi:MOSC domain-containing protein YiiM
MQLLSVNVGQAKLLTMAKGPRRTGIFKVPTSGPVEVTPEGLAGDVICDGKHHGGLDQALYVYGGPDYEWWSRALGYDLTPGTFGENLTIAGLESAGLNVGDTLYFAGVVAEVTAPRIPCSTLAVRMGDPAFAKQFQAAERPGVYCRVIRTGPVQAGELVTISPYRGETVSVLEYFRCYYDHQPSGPRLRRLLAAPIDARGRADLEKQLARLPAESKPETDLGNQVE